MKMFYLFLLYFSIASAVIAEAIGDSSKMIFEESQVYTYKFSFFTPDWKDSLEYYKSLPDEEYMPASMLFYNEKGDTVRFDTIGIRYKGNSSYTYSSHSIKRPIKVKFDKYIDDQLFYGVKRLNFSVNVRDPSFMREKISYDIIRNYIPAPRTAYANIYIEDTLIGLYTQIEQIDKTFLEMNFDDNGGNLYKASGEGGKLIYRNPNQSSYNDEYELKTNEKENNWSDFIYMINLLNNTPDEEFVDVVSKYLDLDNCIRHLAFTVVLSHFDSYTGTGRNFYFYDDPTSGKFMILPWDLDMSFGAHSYNWDVYEMDIVNIPNLKERPLNRRILENDSLRKVYFNYVRGMMDGPASVESISAAADKIKDLVEEHVFADENKMFTDEDFIKNIEENVNISDGFQLIRLPGIKSFPEKRYKNIRDQIEKNLPARPRLAEINKNGCIANAFSSKNNGLTVKYNVKKTDMVKIRLVSAQGKTVKILDQGIRRSGQHIMKINDCSIPSGFYAVDFSIGNVKTALPLLIAY